MLCSVPCFQVCKPLLAHLTVAGTGYFFNPRSFLDTSVPRLHGALLRERPHRGPLALSGLGQAVASKSSALNLGLLGRRFIPCVTWRTVSVHPAPQQRGVCHTYLGNQSLWLFSYRDNVDATVARCLSHPSLRPFWA